MKKILFTLRKPPHSGVYTQEMLDAIMTVAAFDQEVSILLLDDSVFQLKKHQDPSSSGLKNTAAMFKALPLYDIENIYVESESLLERGLTIDCLEQPIKPITRQQIGQFFTQFDLVLPG